jgi:hypothetical protein
VAAGSWEEVLLFDAVTAANKFLVSQLPLLQWESVREILPTADVVVSALLFQQEGECIFSCCCGGGGGGGGEKFCHQLMLLFQQCCFQQEGE